MEKVSINKSIKLSEHLASPSEAALSHLSELNGLRLSPHFTLGEVTKSKHAEIYNIPSHVAIENLKRVCKWLEALRLRYNLRYVYGSVSPPESGGEINTDTPIIINSGYRSPELNKKVGGSPTSNHLTGCAVDIRVYGIEQAMRYAVILMDYADETKQDYDEILIEKNRYGAIWLHFAVRPKENRRKTMFLQK
jgi:hypothetical protein